MNDPDPGANSLVSPDVPAGALSSFLQSASLPVMALNGEGRVVFANPPLHALLRLPAGFLAGRPLADFLKSRDVPVIRHHVEQVLKDKRPAGCEIEWITPDGESHWIRLSSHPGLDDAGGALCWACVESLNQSRQLEKAGVFLRRFADAALSALSIKELGAGLFELLRMTFDIRSGYIALAVAPSGRIEYPFVCGSVSGDSDAGSPTGAGLADHLVYSGRVIWWHDLRTHGEAVGSAFAVSGALPDDLVGIPLRTGNRVGGVLVVQTDPPRRHFDAQEVETMLGAARLIELYLARTKSHESELRLGSAMEQISEVVMITDAQGVLEYVNPAFEQVTGYTREEAIGQKASILHSGQHNRQFYRDMWIVLNSGRTWRGRFVNRRKNGQLFEEEAIISPVRNPAGQTIHYVAVKHHVEPEPRLTGADGRTGDAEVISRLNLAFAHDFRNILLTIQNNAELLRSRITQQEELQQIVDASHQAEALLGEWTSLSSSGSSGGVVLDINQQVIRFEPLARKLMGEGRELSLDLSPRLHPVRLMPGQVEHLLTSLLLLALRTAPEGAVFQIRTLNDTIDPKEKASFVEAPVTNDRAYAVIELSGPGVASDYDLSGRPSVWNDGIPGVVARVKKQRGYVSVKRMSASDGVISIYLPAERSDSFTPVPMEAPPAPLARGHETILVAEDDPGARRVIVRILQDQGYQVIEAESGATAMRAVLYYEGKIDLLLTDIMMPDFDGRILAGQIVSLKPGIKVVYASGYDLLELQEKGVLSPGDSITLFKKPFRRDELLSLVRGMLDAPA